MLTLCAFLSGISAGIAVVLHCLYLACILLCISGLCDILDGSLARLQNNAQPIGAYIDLISDRMVESAFIYGCAIAYPEHIHAYITFFIALLLHFTTFVAAGALFKNSGNKSMHYDSCLIERGEAFACFCAMLLFADYMFWILTVLNIGIFASAINRFIKITQKNSSTD
jgi:phosphatidylglycerophosphate synthase